MTPGQPEEATPKAGRSGAAHQRTTGSSDMWSVQGRDGSIATGWVIMPLRLFLGVTFFFAGLQKLANPDFLKSASPISIHAQLVGATHSSPIHALITHLVPIAPVVGVVIALGEVAIGLGVLVGLWTRVAAVAGMALSFGLFLTVSFHSSPYFTGSDIVFVFAWTPLALGGTAGGPSLDTWLARSRPPVTATSGEVTRRAVLSKGAVTGVTAVAVLIAGGVAAALGRAVGGTTTAAGGTATLSGGSGSTTPPTTAAPTTTGAGGSTPSTTDAAPSTTQALPSGQEVGAASQVPVGGSAVFTVPGSGDPGLVIQQQAGEFVAFDAICPHAGCTVAYQMSSKIIACPCHGSEFNPKTGDVVRGPATHGLTKVKVSKASNGNLYVAD
jgi:thiosulfate dehydrogenase [quinone] large subunit